MDQKQAVQEVVNTMNVPPFKMDLEKGTNVVWLLQNLGARNAERVEYPKVMLHLVSEARNRNLMKRSVLDQLESKFK